jgi:anaerobic selenocysteine-containing dehydrogenase
MKMTRRTFLKGSSAAGGGLVLSRFLSNAPETLVAKEASSATVEEFVPTTCWIGKQDCGMLARRINGRVVSLEGHPLHPRNKGTLCPKGVAQLMAVYDPNRVKAPLLRTNEKGVPGKWRQISWDEALTLVAEKMNEVRKRDKRLLVWQKGRSKAKNFYDKAFVKASGATKLHHGAYCSDAGYRAAEYTLGPHGVLHPDFRDTRYLLSWGWNITNAGGNKTCWLTWPQQLTEARERGLKVVHIDPRLRSAGPFADEWIPIKPQTDLALALALSRELIQRGTIDREYLMRHTNSPFLVKEDGFFLRVNGKEQVWDSKSGSAKPFDAEGVEPALGGTFTVGEDKVKTAFQVFKDHVAGSTPEWAAGICDIPAETIRRIARELGENAMIGSTVVVDGKRIPYRPVGIMAYHMTQTELGFQTIRAMMMLFMLLGAYGAVGGPKVDRDQDQGPALQHLSQGLEVLPHQQQPVRDRGQGDAGPEKVRCGLHAGSADHPHGQSPDRVLLATGFHRVLQEVQVRGGHRPLAFRDRGLLCRRGPPRGHAGEVRGSHGGHGPVHRRGCDANPHHEAAVPEPGGYRYLPRPY